jgi:aspartyl-tRNA(Asn)/glutamyl-tRNA(Gln) amidotransferase subunit B
MRVDVNVSVSSDTIGGNRVEIKNVAGARNVERAVEYEYRRHIGLLSQGKIPEFETRRYDAEKDITHSLRRKEEEPDYRFFQDPDLPAFEITPAMISSMQRSMVELPFDVKKRFCQEFQLEVSETKVIFRSSWAVELFNHLVCDIKLNAKLVYKW